MKKTTAIFTLCFLCLVSLISGCNTMAGAGQDIQQGGQAIQSAAQH